MGYILHGAPAPSKCDLIVSLRALFHPNERDVPPPMGRQAEAGMCGAMMRGCRRWWLYGVRVPSRVLRAFKKNATALQPIPRRRVAKGLSAPNKLCSRREG